jgi:hypothetical protein
MTNRKVFFWVNENSEPYANLCGRSAFAGATDYPLVFFDDKKVTRKEVVGAIAGIV